MAIHSKKQHQGIGWYRKILLGVAAVGLLAGCGGGVGDIKPEEQAGHQVYQEYCGQCHEKQSPKRYTAAEWPEVVDRMRTHMKEKQRKEMSDKQTQDLMVFLKGHAKK